MTHVENASNLTNLIDTNIIKENKDESDELFNKNRGY
jgi:hypothetical protein